MNVSPVAPLQWGHDLSVVEMRFQTDVYTRGSELQWGHDLSVVEMISDMGTGLNGNGFNGATTFRSWKCSATKQADA